MVLFFSSIYFTYEVKKGLFYINSLNELFFPLVFIFTQIIFSTLLLPCSIFSMLAGYIWGFKFGILISTISTVLSGMTTFLIARNFSENSLAILNSKKKLRLLENRFLSYFKIKSRNEVLESFVVSVNPILPAASFGYIFGSGRIHIKNYFLGLMAGAFLLNTVFVLWGTMLNQII